MTKCNLWSRGVKECFERQNISGSALKEDAGTTAKELHLISKWPKKIRASKGNFTAKNDWVATKSN